MATTTSRVLFTHSPPSELHVTLETERLRLRTFTQFDRSRYESLFSGREDVTNRIHSFWLERWRRGDPFSAMVVETKDHRFVGHIILEDGNRPGEAEISYLFKRTFDGMGYEKEAVTALVTELAAEYVSQGYYINGLPLGTVTASCSESDLVFKEIAASLGMILTSMEVEQGGVVNKYTLKVDRLSKK